MHICSIGECMVELSSSKDGKFNFGFAGDTANTAIYLSRLGAKTSYLTAVGNDDLSKKMINYFNKEKILTNNILVNYKKTVGLYLIENDTSGEREFFYWRSDSAAKKLFDDINITKFYQKFINYDVIYFSGITLSIYNTKNLNKFYFLLKLLKKNNIQICMDLNIRLKNWINKDIVNKVIKKFSLLCNIIFISNEDIKFLKIKHFKDFVSDYSKNALVIYRHGSGMIKVYKNKEFLEYIVKLEKKVIDVTGCGDAFNASFLINYMKDNSLDQCIKASHRLGKKVAFTRGAIIKKEKFVSRYYAV